MSSPFYQQEALVKLRELIAEHKSDGWEEAWKKSITPWDSIGKIQPPLEELYKSDEVNFPKSGRALVPGCGKGYDAVYIASQLGLEVTATDISPSAIAAAKEHLNSHPSPPANVTFALGDFFKLEDVPTYELVNDYTFFQALLPELRPAWGTKMRNIVKPGGFLVVLAFPVDAPREIGPPFGIDAETHTSVLGSGWVKLVDRVPTNSSEVHVGMDRLIVFQKL